MPDSILVGYSTVYGSTREVAEAIAEILRKGGQKVDLLPAREVRSLEGYRAVVLGAPLYMMRWHKDANRFLSRHSKELATMPVAIFALGPFHNKEEELQSAGEHLDKSLNKFPWLKPITKEVFVGKFDPTALKFPYSMIGPLKEMPASDERNWEDIHTWANNLTELLSGKN